MISRDNYLASLAINQEAKIIVLLTLEILHSGAQKFVPRWNSATLFYGLTASRAASVPSMLPRYEHLVLDHQSNESKSSTSSQLHSRKIAVQTRPLRSKKRVLSALFSYMVESRVILMELLVMPSHSASHCCSITRNVPSDWFSSWTSHLLAKSVVFLSLSSVHIECSNKLAIDVEERPDPHQDIVQVREVPHLAWLDWWRIISAISWEGWYPYF